jgi:predicted amidohydrolase YtcJ
MPRSNHFAGVGIAPPLGDVRPSIVQMKFYGDGTLIGAAWFAEPSGPLGELTGSNSRQPDQLKDLGLHAHRNGWQVGIDTERGAAVEMSLDAIELAMRATPRAANHHRIEHCGYPTRDHIGLMATVGVILVSHRSFLVDCGDDFIRHLGERAHR